MSNLSAVGRLSKLYGEGLLLNFYDSARSEFNKKEPLFVVIDKLEVPLFISSINFRGKNSAVVVFDDIDTPYRMSEFIGMEVLTPTTLNAEDYDDPSDDAIYFEDMEGWNAVLDKDTEGVIIRFLDGENPLFLIEVDQKEVFIPAQDEFFEEFNPAERTVHFTLPEGLLGLYLG